MGIKYKELYLAEKRKCDKWELFYSELDRRYTVLHQANDMLYRIIVRLSETIKLKVK